MGTRIKGTIHRGAMPFLHRWLGTPVLTLVLDIFFQAHISDVNCGMRGFRKDAVKNMRLRAEGMEFASEMIVKAAQERLIIAETPIHYYPPPPDRASNLRSWRDGWRHLRFMLILCPKYLFLIPGSVIALFGFLLILLTFFKTIVIFNMPLGLSTFVLSHALFFMGIQIILFGIYASILSRSMGLIKHDPITNYFKRYFTLERGLVAGAIVLAIGLAMILLSFSRFLTCQTAPGAINLPLTRLAIASVFVTLFGMQIVFVSFYMGFFDIDQTLK
jgi:hypothetical protein